MKKIVIAGGSGYLGSLIVEELKKNFAISILSRTQKGEKDNIQFVPWNAQDLGEWTNSLEGAYALINLTGKSINTKFTEKNKKAILKSRVNSTLLLGKAIENCTKPPKKWLNASSVAYYKESWKVPMDEESTEVGSDFLSRVSQKWEEAFYHYPTQETQKIIFRISLILGDHPGSAYFTLKKLVKTGLGGKAGNGKQKVSWMSETDFVRAILFLLDKPYTGPFNFCNANVLTNEQLMSQLREKYKVSLGLPAPKFIIKLGSQFINTSPDLVLRSQYAVPTRLLNEGFTFDCDSIDEI